MKKGLGRGLGALLDMDGDIPAKSNSFPSKGKTPVSGAVMADIRKIEPNTKQPRKFFDESALNELADSIKSFGIIQPLIVKDNGGWYSIIAGERRFRAARMAKLTHVPVMIKEYSETDDLQIALIENIQRQDLTPIEEASCYKRLVEDFFFSAEDVAKKVGKNKHTVQNMMLLLELDSRVQGLAAEGRLTSSHGRALLAVKDGGAQYETALRIVEKGLSVRQTEELVKKYNTAKKTEEKILGKKLSENAAAAYRKTEDELQGLFGSKVHIKPGKTKGRIEIEYYSPSELERILGMFKRLSTHNKI